MFCLRSSVIVRPFQSASTRLPDSSASLALQSIGLNSTSTPMRLAASRAMSMSKPTSWFLSSRKPIGGKLSSRPITIFVTAAAGVAGGGGGRLGAVVLAAGGKQGTEGHQGDGGDLLHGNGNEKPARRPAWSEKG